MRDLPDPFDKLLSWYYVPGQEFAHARWRFLAASRRVALCSHDLGQRPLAADHRSACCPTCVYVTEIMHQACLDCPRHQAFSDHPMVAATRAEFDAAGGRWAALQPGHFDMRGVRREIEAVVRAHIDNPMALLREVTGYLELAVAAAQHDISAPARTPARTTAKESAS